MNKKDAERLTNCIDHDYSVTEYCHDIQKILRNISNQLQIVKTRLQHDNTRDSELVSYVDSAIKNVITLGNWSRNLLQESNRRPTSRVDLSSVIEEIERLLGLNSSRKACTIRIDPMIPCLNCNFFEIICVFQNLVENSMDHSTSDQISININLLECAQNMITILFSDNRGPLQKEEKEKIRAFIDDNSDNGSFGLSICKRMLNNSGGSIKFIENSKGCAYEISLPVFLDGGAGGDKRI